MNEQPKEIKSGDIAILGGTCSEMDALALVNAWPTRAQMTYGIWEFSDEIKWDANVPDTAEFLERGRLFGEGGDLALRRDGDHFRWRFVGPKGTQLQKGFKAKEPEKFDAKDFWQHEPSAVYYEETASAMLWGSREKDKNSIFWEDRVAGANLNYPAPPDAKRVGVLYHTYSRAGRVEFVWFRELKAHNQEVQNG